MDRIRSLWQSDRPPLDSARDGPAAIGRGGPEPVEGPLTWVFAGDSITQGIVYTHGWRGYTELFKERLWELGRWEDLEPCRADAEPRDTGARARTVARLASCAETGPSPDPNRRGIL